MADDLANARIPTTLVPDSAIFAMYVYINTILYLFNLSDLF